MKKFNDLLRSVQDEVREIFPWDLSDKLKRESGPLILDVREPYEFEAMHIEGSLLVPRGILETACEYGYEETIPDLVTARAREIVVVCRSGNRSLLAAYTMKLLGYKNVWSLKTGLRGWNDYEQALVDRDGNGITADAGDEYFAPRVTPEQLGEGESNAEH
jgi:rhodanese-related sulfurtransferase